MKENDQEFEVKMGSSGDGPPTRTYTQVIKKFDKLGKEVKISPKSHVVINKPGFKTEFFIETVTLLIGIGKNHTADLVMTKDAWEALNKGEVINIDTDKQFKKRFL